MPPCRVSKKLIKAALKQLWHEHIDASPRDQRADLACDLLIAIRVGSQQARLYRTNRTMLIEEDRKALLRRGNVRRKLSIGSSPGVLPTCHRVFCIADSCLHCGCRKGEYSECWAWLGCAYSPRSGGLPYSLTAPECRKVEEDFARVFAAFREIIVRTGNTYNEQLAELYWKQLKTAVNTARENQQERMKRHLDWDARPATPPDPQGSKDDPLSPPPSREIPEGTDES